MNNNEARAYAALAMEQCNVSSLTAVAVLEEMWNLFDRMTEYEAADMAVPIIAQFERKAQMIERNGFPARRQASN